MATPDPRMKQMADIFKILQDSVTKEEFIQGLEALKKRVDAVGATNEKEFKLMQGALAAISKKMEADHSGDMSEMRKACDVMMKQWAAQIEQKMLEVDDAMDSVEDGADGRNGIDGKPGPKGEKGDTGPVGPAGDNGTTVRVGWGAHPLVVQGLGVVIDKNTRVINFKGTAVTSVVRAPDGTVNVTLTAGGGTGGGTLVQEEVPVDSGDHINFTLAHTPLTGTFYLWRGGARQQSIGTSPDFTQTGTALVLTNALNVAQGETILVSYSY